MLRKKAVYFTALFFLAFGLVLLGRLAWLQLFQHSELVALADKQQVKTVEVTTACRGSVLDRNGDAITNPGDTPSVLVFPSLVSDVDATAEALAQVSDLSAQALASKIAGKNQSGEEVRYQPFYAKTNLTAAEEKDVESMDLKGVFVVGYQSRYLRDTPLQHTLGSLGAVTEEQILKGEVGSDYQAGDIIGMSGLERIYESNLKGTGGKKFGVVVDEKNRAIEKDRYYVFQDDSENTQSSLELTVDLGIQRCVENALEGVSGAAVVLDSTNGDVLALASSPKFDPLYIEAPPSEDAYVNKALQPYPPASLFKIFVTAVGLENQVISPETTVVCNGSYTLANGREIHCWQEEGHGLMTFSDALAQSCNPVFIDLGLKIGHQALAAAFKEWELDDDMLLGYPLGDLSSFDAAATDSALANAVLGEEGVFLTPLNIAKLINVIATGGLLTTPRLVTVVRDETGEISKTYPPALSNRVISQTTAETVKAMMLKTFTDGTGKSLGLDGLGMAGKTGSSETSNVWIGGFLPAEEPRYTVVILVENGSSGVGDAGPVLKKIAGYLETLDAEPLKN